MTTAGAEQGVRASQRARLAAEQARMVRSLVAGGVTPEGYDEGRIELTARALKRKRRQSLLRAWPSIEASLGATTREWLDRFFAARPSVPESGPWFDGAEFLIWFFDEGLVDNGRVNATEISFGLATQALRIRLEWRRQGEALVRRRGLRVSMIRRKGRPWLLGCALPRSLGGRVTILRWPSWLAPRE